MAGFGYNFQATAATPSPTSIEDAERSGIEVDGGGSSDGDSSWWVAAAAGAGVGLGIVFLGALLFSCLGKNKRGGPKATVGSGGGGEGLASETKAEPA